MSETASGCASCVGPRRPPRRDAPDATISGEQLGANDLRLARPDGVWVTRETSIPGARGVEMLAFVAESAGPYWLEVRSLSRLGSTGRFALTIDERRPASQADRDRAESRRLAYEFANADGRRRS